MILWEIFARMLSLFLQPRGYEIKDGLTLIYVNRLIPNWAAAQTWGRIILLKYYDERLLSHEKVHVEQWKKLGFLFPLAYVLNSIIQIIKGKHPYFDNKYEVEARNKSGY